jgi:ABC-2 type transport system ATP-binding protein
MGRDDAGRWSTQKGFAMTGEPAPVEAALHFESATKYFGATVALDGCSFSVPRGAVCALVGRNGSGKTTAMRAAVGFLALDRGVVTVEGRPVRPGAPSPVSYLAQGRPLHGALTVDDTLAYAHALAGGAFAGDLARDWVQEHDVPLDRPVRSLSGGQRTQVALAAAVARTTPVVELDEPMADLDPVARSIVSERLGALAAAGRSVLVSSHAVTELSGFCDHIVVFDHGRAVIAGPVGEVAQNRPLDEVVLEVLRKRIRRPPDGSVPPAPQGRSR